MRGYVSADRGEAEAEWLYTGWILRMQARHPMDVALVMSFGGPGEWSGHWVGCVYKMRLVLSGLDSLGDGLVRRRRMGQWTGWGRAGMAVEKRTVQSMLCRST